MLIRPLNMMVGQRMQSVQRGFLTRTTTERSVPLKCHRFRRSELVAEAGGDDLHAVARPDERDGKEASGRDRPGQSYVVVEGVVEVLDTERDWRINQPLSSSTQAPPRLRPAGCRVSDHAR